MRWNTRSDNIFRRTRWAFFNAFRETRNIYFYYKKEHTMEPSKFSLYRQDCPPAILHVRDIWHSMNRKRDGILITGLRGFALILSGGIELPVLLVKSLIIDIITLPISAITGFMVDLVELATNIVSDIACLPAAMVDGLADKVFGKPSAIEQYSSRTTEHPGQTAQWEPRGSGQYEEQYDAYEAKSAGEMPGQKPSSRRWGSMFS